MNFDRTFFGPQGFTAEDVNQGGSLYSHVREAVFRNAYYLHYGAEGESPLPVYEVNWWRVAKGLLPLGSRWLFRQAAERVVDSQADLRWGDNRRGYRRLLHPNGVCLFGKWVIDQANPWSGYFRCGSKALIVGRYSTCCTQTVRGRNRSLSLVGKLFPTIDENHSQPLKTATFITQEDLGGTNTPFINDVVCRNAPDVTPWRRGLGAPILLLSGLLFKLVDREPAIRQLHTVAELGMSANEPTLAPQFMRLVVDQDQQKIGETQAKLDFRDEILQQLNSAENRTLTFHIEATDEGRIKGLLVKRGVFPKDAWRRIGRIDFHEAVCSYNGDFVLHFPHPRWRSDRNDRATEVRKKV
jgi:hypothetical protein